VSDPPKLESDESLTEQETEQLVDRYNDKLVASVLAKATEDQLVDELKRRGWHSTQATRPRAQVLWK